MSKKGLLVVNLGTPDSTEVSDVRRYLGQFLNDPRVLDINPIGRRALVHGVILRTRPAKSAEAYRKVWDAERGSPLLYHGLDLVEGLRKVYGSAVPVELAMRYQNPSIESAVRKLRSQGVEHLVVFPLFPQYSSAATGSAFEETLQVVSKHWNVPGITMVKDYYEHPAFINAWLPDCKKVLEEKKPELLLMSFHGLPERHCEKSDWTDSHCLKKENCCGSIVEANRDCYRAQCYATARALASALGLSDKQYQVSFQSRLGKTPWIKPYTDEVLEELQKSGVKKLAVVCPSFTADCLETLEEVGIGLKEDFLSAGGEDFNLIDCLNSNPVWVRGVCEILAEYGLQAG